MSQEILPSAGDIAEKVEETSRGPGDSFEEFDLHREELPSDEGLDDSRPPGAGRSGRNTGHHGD